MYLLNKVVFAIYESMFLVDINVDIMELDSDQVCLLFLHRIRSFKMGVQHLSVNFFPRVLAIFVVDIYAFQWYDSCGIVDCKSS